MIKPRCRYLFDRLSSIRMYKGRLIQGFFLAVSLTVLQIPVHAQYRAAFSSAGGSGTSLQFTLGESITGAIASSDNFRVSTGFYRPDPVDGTDFLPPVIADITPIRTPAGQDVTIQTDITDGGTGVQTATLFYRSGGNTTYSQTPMSNSGGDAFAGTIPSASVTSSGADFFITATDVSGNPARNPASNATPLFVEVAAPGRESTLRSGQQQSDYRLISVPLNLDTKSSASVLADLGPYDNTKWRFWSLKSNYFDFEGEEQFNELRNGANFDPGAAFFILSADGGTFRTGDAISLSTVEPFTKTLHRGWNFLGNPFDFNVPTAALSLSSGAAINVQTFAGGWSAASALQPFTGYIVDAGDDTNVTLSIDPSSGTGKAGKREEQPAHVAHIDWSLRIDAHSGDYFDINNRIESSPNASREWDEMDRPEPPVFGDYVSLYFPHQEWGRIHKRYQTDVRPEPSTGDTWDFEVVAGTRRSVILTFEDLESVPTHYSIQLIDPRTGLAQDIRRQPTYSFNLPGNNEPWPFQLLIGESNFIQDQVNDLDLFPKKFELDQNYPNPFNPSTSIRYGVSEASVVSLTVYNVLGQVVATLVNQESKSPGYHVAHWDARADDGSEIASGLYVYQLQVSSSPSSESDRGDATVITRKMLFIK